MPAHKLLYSNKYEMKDSDLPFEKKLLLDVVEQMSDPEKTMGKQRVMCRTLYAIGYIGLLLAFILALNEVVHPFTSAFLAAIAGCTLGFAVFLQSARKQWPVTRKHIDMESVRKRLNELETE